MSIPPFPRLREKPVGERITELLAKRSRRASRLVEKSKSAAGPQSPESLLAEAAWLEEQGLERVRALALAKGLDSYASCWPDVFAEAFTPPADAVYAAYQRLVSEDSPLRQYVRESQVPTVGGWYARLPELRRAGELRQAAFKRDYPTLLCSSCHRLSGWLSGGRCDYCLWAEQVSQLMKTGSIYRWEEYDECIQLAARYDQAARAEYQDVRRGPGPHWGPFGRKRHEQEAALAFAKVVHDLLGDWGPSAPKEGYELWIPERFELESMDGSTLLLHFRATRYRWQDSCFCRLDRSLRQADFVTPLLFAADLASAPLATAWHDFRLEVEEHNRREWQESVLAEERTSTAALREEARRTRIEEQRGVAGLLEV